METKYTFVSVARAGIAGVIGSVDTFDESASGRATFRAAFTVTGNVSSTDVGVDVRVHGPGDVTGIDPRQVIRTEPKALTQNYEPNFFAAVEFDRPDFPWMMTPLKESPLVVATDPTTASARLRPWIVLVAVRRQDGISLKMQPGRQLPVLEIAAPASVRDELQALTDSWAWAHAQTVGGQSDAAGVIRNGPVEHNSSRLLCPKRLRPQSSYIACVVPAFRLGVLAGLGLPVTDADEAKLEAAWHPTDSTVRLPVYFHFEFNTGPDGDFEALADLLAPRSLTADDVTIPLDIASTGDSRLPIDAPQIRLDGALSAGKPPEFDNLDYQSALAGIVNQPEPTLDPLAPDPVVAPPIYGRWHAARQSVTPEASWLSDLNLDPRRRIAAGLGTRVVQEHQEEYMTIAWSQLGEILKVNALLRRAQLARAAMDASHAKTVAKLQGTVDRIFSLVAPMNTRLLDDAVTIAVSFRASRVPEGIVSPAFRKLTRARGALANRLFQGLTPLFAAEGNGETPIPSLIESINAKAIAVVPFKSDTGMIDGKTIGTTTPIPTPAVAAAAPSLAGGVLDDPSQELPGTGEGAKLSDPTVDPKAAHSSLVAVQHFLGAATGPKPVPILSARPALVTALGDQSGTRITPGKTLPERLLARLGLNGVPLVRSLVDVFEPVLAAPQITQPMYAPLRDLSPEFLLPGVSRIPPNTVTLLDTNPAYVEAYMVGLNHEMARELLWRGFPTDQRGTCFSQFWDPSCRVPPARTAADREARRDIVPIHTWPLDTRLGDHQPVDPGRASGSQVVLVIRGELLRRYPNTIIYAAPEKDDPQGHFDLDESKEEVPIFRGTIPPDITFIGFNLTDADVRSRRLYFVLQEQPTEPRFGLNDVEADKIDPNADLTAWEDLAWGHFGPGAEFVEVGKLPNAKSLPTNPVWGVNSAHMASITLQTPVRVAIFGPDILPAP